MTAALRRSFDSLKVPNFRRYFKGQVVSLSGNWMQTVAEVWLILSLTNSGFAVGLATALQFLPILVLGAWGGSLADRFAKRNLLMVTQGLMMIPPLVMLGVTAAGVVTPAMVFGLILIRGTLLAVDNPARQAFVMEMVGPDRIVNAVSLNSVIVHSARVAGPAVAGILIATVGVAPCFGLNAATYLVMIWALYGMDPRRLSEPPRTDSREPGRVRAAVRHVLDTPELAMPLLLMAVVGTLGLNFQVILPLLARLTFEGGASSYAVLVSSMGAGSVIGALVTGARGKTGMGVIAASALAFGGLAMAAALMPSLASEIPILALLGASAVTFAAAINSTIQLAVIPEMRGRVMALYSVVFLGSTPIGGPLVGFISESADPRLALAMASISGLVAAAGAWWISGRNRQRRELKPA
ncbi:MAG: MFS transporter [Solirubrobacterales bacterium]|nr:MFS transporter [Solirubrobacterales bacterium]OJU94343.1 MAG: MFS transporter [Solirubrobacterales bacterium 67-14]